MKVKILPAVCRDLVAGYRFYESRATGVGAYFMDTLFSEIDSLVLHAGIHPIHFQRYHRLLSRRFPFAIYYQLKGDTAFVHAVLDCRRNPDAARKRLEDERT